MRKFAGFLTLSMLLFSLTLSGCTTATNRPVRGTPPATAEQAPAGTTLVVALYPWVPRMGQFQDAITTAWASVQPGVPLSFLSAQDWDGGYSNNPPPNADVYVFDAMFFAYFRSQGLLEPMSASEIQNLNDFVPYAIQGVQAGGQYYAIPQLGCANILFYQQSDAALANATTLTQIKNALSQCTYTSQVPPDRRGLMIDMSGGTTNATLYLDTVHSVTGQYPPPLPWNESQINPVAMNNMRLLLAMASYENGTTDESAPYQRGTWFSNGWGRAVVGYTESMSAMSQQTLAGIGFKVMPLSDNDQSAMFYADVIGVNTTTRQRGTRNLAVQLANVMASSATMVASIGPSNGNPPQYLMATRPSVFQKLGQSFPIYNRMYSLITTSNPVMFSIDSQSRNWLASPMKNIIRTDAREDYPCHCDYQATQFIPDNSTAPAICTATCANHGGWSGTWTNQYPAAPAGTSACGCNACPAP
jgi:thiamine pyridinylase